MVSADIVRWVNASVNKYFNDAKAPYFLYIAGQDFDPTQNESWCELHYSDGPNIEENVKDDFRVTLTLTLMCSAIPTNDLYLIHKITGHFLNLASQSIPIKKYGDDGTLIDCMDPIGVSRLQQWGFVQVASGSSPLRVKQTHIETNYLLTF